MFKNFRRMIIYGHLTGIMDHYERLQVGGWEAEAASMRERIANYIVQTET